MIGVKENLPFVEEDKRKPVVTVELLIGEYEEEVNGPPAAWNNLAETAPKDALGVTDDGFPVYDRPNSHLHQEMTPLWREALSLVHLGWDKVMGDYQNWQQQAEQNPNLRQSGLAYILDVDFGRQIGESTCVETSERDQIIFAVRQKRLGYTRFVSGRSPRATSHTALIIRLDEKRMQVQPDSPAFILLTSYVGKPSPPEPWSPLLTHDQHRAQQAQDFWGSHALVWNKDSLKEVDWSHHVVTAEEIAPLAYPPFSQT